MLLNGPYPHNLKKRISGDNGHLSNYHAGLLVLEHASPQLRYIFLSHMSENNNNPDIAKKTFSSIISQRKDLSELKVIITSRYHVSESILL
jgi:phosphoribosyl 1,2-cyclic phosphodiesterase